MHASPSALRSITRIDRGSLSPADDRVAVEEPLEIRIADVPLAVTMRTPTGVDHDRQLAAGFCLTEGVIAHADDLESVEPCTIAEYGNVVIVRLTEEAAARRAACISSARRDLFMNSSCGICGKQSIDRLHQQTPPIRGVFTVSPSALSQLPQRMRDAQSTFDATGGLHAAALFTPQGELRLLREDVGRHNAVDKLIGAALLTGVPTDPAILLVSGRTSFEIVQKAAMAGIAVVAAVSAPSSLAVDTASDLGITLIGFLREGRMNVYCDRGRIE
ncbi:MAG: formate dehydrogenase accessory sulfurtransferase FdhD [Phycisphaeraceae bacterium]